LSPAHKNITGSMTQNCLLSKTSNRMLLMFVTSNR